MEYYDLKICTDEVSLSHRSYVLVNYQGNRYKEYSGKSIKMNIYPNKAKTIKQKIKLLDILSQSIAISISRNEYKSDDKPSLTVQNLDAEYLLNEALKQKT